MKPKKQGKASIVNRVISLLIMCVGIIGSGVFAILALFIAVMGITFCYVLFSKLLNAGNLDAMNIILSIAIVVPFVIATILAAFLTYKTIEFVSAGANQINEKTVQKSVEKAVYQQQALREVNAIQQLPTTKSIQQLISEDGEIPDDAYRRHHD